MCCLSPAHGGAGRTFSIGSPLGAPPRRTAMTDTARAQEVAGKLKRQIAMDTHRLALMPQSQRAAYEADWRILLEQSHGE